MPTLTQLQAESWWGREVITPELRWLATEICARTKRPLVAAGTKGDQFHLAGAHRSQEWIKRSRWCTDRTYTVQANLTAEQARHVAGFDFTPGSAQAMIAQSKRIMAAVKSGRLEAVHEFYGNINGDRWVDGWDNLRNRAATSDDSHLWHWHLSIDRRKLRDKALMQRILAVALGLDEEEDVELTAANLEQIAKATVDEWIRRDVAKLTGDAATMSLGPATSYIHKNGFDIKAAVTGTLVPGQAAILAAVAGDSGDQIVAKLDELAAAEQARDDASRAELLALLEQASIERAEIAELVGQAASGELDAEELLRLLGEKLTAGDS